MQNHNLNAAVIHLSDAHAALPTDDRITRQLALTLVERGKHSSNTINPDLSEAEMILTHEIRLSRFPIRLQAALTHVRRQSGNIAGALESSKVELTLRPQSIEAFEKAGRIAFQANRFGLASKYLQRALDLSDLAYLDPLQQLPGIRRGELIELIAEAESRDLAPPSKAP